MRVDAVKWTFIQQHMPITGVDVLPVQRDSGSIVSIGLIRRETPDEGQRWCLIGGRLWRNESLGEAVKRQLWDTLGNAEPVQMPVYEQPDFIIQYFTEPRLGCGVDRRQHAIGLTYCLNIDGGIHPRGEALDFAWFDLGALPSADEVGFNQYPHITAYLQRMTLRTTLEAAGE